MIISKRRKVIGEADAVEIAKNAARASGRAARRIATGRQLFLNENLYRERKDICDRCEWWDAGGYGGVGKCRKCGCSRFKLYLATERCPIDKWGRVDG